MFDKLNRAIRGSNNTAIKSSTSTALTTKSNNNNIQIMDPSSAVKTDLFSRNVLNFIAGTHNTLGGAYTEDQLLGAYLSSVYAYAALKRVSNLISRVKIVAEVEYEGEYVRAPENYYINKIFEQNGPEVLSRMYLNYAVYGAAAVYKVKSAHAVLEENRGNPIYRYDEGAVAGLYALDKPMWDVDEEATYGRIKGLHVNQYSGTDDILGDKNYLEREEFIFTTDWNPKDPNRGKSMIAVAIHEAVANSAIAQWMSDYFTRGAMPFILVAMEEDPDLITTADLRKYKRQFEEYWQGVDSSLRSVFMDRKVSVEQVGVPASDVAAPDLNETALEGIASVIGIDRKLIVTTDGGAYAEHVQIKKRAWEDTVIPLASKFLSAFSEDLGLPNNMRLVLDLSDITELEADRDEKSSIEISIYESGIQNYNETRSRLQMSPIEDLDGWMYFDGKPTPIEKIVSTKNIPIEDIRSYAMELWDSNLAKRSEVLSMLGRNLPRGEKDGYRQDIEGLFDYITELWGEDLLTRKQVLSILGFKTPFETEDGYRSELERGADYGEWVTSLWADNLLTRSQTMQLLSLDVSVPEGVPDGYADEIGDRKSNIMDYWGDNLMTRTQAMNALGIDIPENVSDGFFDEINIEMERMQDAKQDRIDNIMDFWGRDLLKKSDAIELLELPELEQEDFDGFQEEIEKQRDANADRLDRIGDYWGDNLMTRQQVLESIGIQMPQDAVDGYQQEVDIIAEALAEQRATELTTPPDGGDDEGGFRSIMNPPSDDDSPPDGTGADKIYPEENIDDVDNWEAIVYDVLPDEVLEEHLKQDEDEDLYTEMDNTYFDMLIGYEEIGDENEYIHILDSIPEEDHLKDYEDNAISGAEEDYLEDITEYDDFPLTGHYGEMVDVLEPSVLPTLPDDIQEFDDDVPAFDLRTDIFPLDEGSAIAADDDIKDVDEINIDNTINEVLGENTHDLFISLSFGNQESIFSKQQEILEQFDEDDIIEAQDPDTFHITLAYVDEINQEDLEKVMELLPKKVNNFTITSRGINYFENTDFNEGGDSHAIYLEVELNDNLRHLQQRIVSALNTYGISISEYSYPNNYTPHITMAYVDSSVDMPKFDDKFVLTTRPVSIHIECCEYDLIDKIPLVNNADKAQQDNAMEELEAWRRATLKSGIKKGLKFETFNMSTDISQQIKNEIKDLTNNDRDSINSIFDKYKKRINQ